MSTRSTSVWPVSAARSDGLGAPDFHLEFGFLCPSPRRRRRLRLATTLILAGMGIATTIELAVAHWRDNDAVAQTLSAGPVDEEPLLEAAAIPQPSGTRVASMQPSGPAALTEAWPLPQHGSCNNAASGDLAAAFLNSGCRAGKVHARHAERTAYRVATIIVGRAESAPASAVEAMPNGATAKEYR
jgi:hypothetical protein